MSVSKQKVKSAGVSPCVVARSKARCGAARGRGVLQLHLPEGRWSRAIASQARNRSR